MFEEFEQSFRRHCEELLRLGLEELRDSGDVDEDSHEDEFTRRIVSEMEKINQTVYKFPFRVTWDEKGKTRFNLGDEDHPNTAKRVDITLDKVTTKGTTEYWIECKRVAAGDSDLLREYWHSGVKRFVDEFYADKYSFAGMAGYIVGGSTQETATELENRSRKYDEEMNLSDPWSKVREHRNMRTFQTSHLRESCPDIEIDHFMLKVQ